jgi:hypothetical protein
VSLGLRVEKLRGYFRRIVRDNASSVDRQRRAQNIWLLALAGLAAGLAFLMRHPGLLLLPFGWLAIWRSSTLNVQITESGVDHTEGKTQNLKPWPEPRRRLKTQNLVIFTFAFLIAIAPQLAINIVQTGRPFYSQQAKNIWQGVFGDGDWGRWAQTANDISIGNVIAQSPDRFLTNWWTNLRDYIGAGGEDASEFGHAVQLRLLGFPANWLAIAGLIGWLVFSFRPLRRGDKETRRQGASDIRLSPRLAVSLSLMLIWVAVYVLAISPGLPLLPRFVLPLAPIYAIAAAWTISQLRPATDEQPTSPAGGRLPLLTGLLLFALLWGGYAGGGAYVLNTRPPTEADLPGQPAEEVAAIQLVQSTVRTGEPLIVRTDPRVTIGKYSAIAHLVALAPAADDPAALRATGAGYLLWDSRLGTAPAVGPEAGRAGPFTLYRINR